MAAFDGADEPGPKTSLREKIYEELRRDIVCGVYKDHEELKENAVARHYQVSRTPVREAFRQLELEGLVTTVPNKGVYVNRISDRDVEEIYAIRALLEGLCAQWAATNAKEEQIEALEEIMLVSRFHYERGNDDQVCVCDNKFHEALYRASGSRILRHLLKDFHEYLQPVRQYALTSRERAGESLKEHEAIVRAIREKNPEEAKRLAGEHIKNTIHNLEAVHFEKHIS